MKSIFLAVVVICALAIAGIGGTFAGYSDTDITSGNSLITGSMDLKIHDGTNWVDNPGPLVAFTKVNPCQSGTMVIKVWNAGDCEPGANLYLKVKNFCCSNVPDKIGQARPEPELVTEEGGWLNQKLINGIGAIGDECCLRSHIDVTVYDVNDQKVWGPEKLIYFVKNPDFWVYVGQLAPCVKDKVTLVFHLQQIHEADLGLDYFPDGSPFEYWPTNGLMADEILFDVEFALVQKE